MIPISPLRRVMALVLLMALSAMAATFTTRLDVDGDEAQVTWSLSGGDSDGDPRFPDFQGLKRISGPSVVTSMNIINGVASREKSWTMTFVNPTGKAVRLGPASVRVDAQTLNSQPVTIPASGQSAGGQQGADGRPARLLFEVEPRRPVVGQPVRLKLRLDFNVNVRGYDPPQLPSAPGFVAEALDRPQTPSTSTRTVNGQNWNTAVLAEWVLFPVKDGRLRLDPLSLNIQVEERQKRRGRDPFDFFGGSMFNRLQTLALSTEPLTLEVAPLPGGAPTTFTGAVGRFTMKAKLDRTQAKAGEALTLTVDIEGSGYFSGVEMPAFTHSPDLEQYDTQTESTVRTGAKGQSGRKRFKTLMVPRLPGSQRIEAFTFTWYDPEAGAYRSASAGPWVLDVGPGEGGAALPGVAAAAGGRVQSYGTDIGLILPAPARLPLRQTPLHHRWPWLSAMLLALLAAPGALVWVNWRSHRLELAPALRVRGARSRLQKRLKSAPGQALVQEEALRGYLADRLGRAATGLLAEDCRRELSFRNAPAVLVEELDTLWRRLEFARYGGGKAVAEEEILGLADQLERWFHKGGDQ